MVEKIVVALGGNAILVDDPSASGQQSAIKAALNHIKDLLLSDVQAVITHGNGPQVGNLLLQQESAKSKENPALPLDSCVGMTQGSIGYWIINEIDKILVEHQASKQVIDLLTRVSVDLSDPAFENPTKPIGPFYSELPEITDKNVKYVEDSGRGYRRVVASPSPKSILESKTINTLLNDDHIVVCCGGGGIPVVKKGNEIVGVEAVIDKDLASAKLASEIGASTLIILTGVPNVYINFNKPDQQKLEHVTVDELKVHVKDNQFAKGSMLPKVEAAIEYLESVENGKVVITSLDNVKEYLTNGAGTIITK